MDHFYQLPMLGPPDANMLECYTTLGALARETSTVRLGALVTGNTYRNPTLLAKIITALDVVSGGRAQLGIGAGWFEFEHDSLGFEFGTFTDRFEKLEEALQIILPMLRDETPVVRRARTTRCSDAINHPAPISRIPVMIGGSGEKKTLRMVAQYADESNLTSPADRAPAQARGDRRALRAARARPEHAHGQPAPERRARADPRAGVRRVRRRARAARHRPAQRRRRLPHDDRGDGDPRRPGRGRRAAGARSSALGADGLTMSAPANGFVPERVEALGEVASKAFG